MGELLFPEFTRRNVNRKLEFTLTKLKFPDGRKYTSKVFRRGATQELLMTGNSLEVAKGSGGWWGSGFRIYVDLEMNGPCLPDFPNPCCSQRFGFFRPGGSPPGGSG